MKTGVLVVITMTLLCAAVPARADDSATWALRYRLTPGTITTPLPDNYTATLSAHSPDCRISIFKNGARIYDLQSGALNGLSLMSGEAVGNRPNAPGDCVVSFVVYKRAQSQSELKLIAPPK
jgi:hypothetical protein